MFDASFSVCAAAPAEADNELSASAGRVAIPVTETASAVTLALDSAPRSAATDPAAVDTALTEKAPVCRTVPVPLSTVVAMPSAHSAPVPLLQASFAC